MTGLIRKHAATWLRRTIERISRNLVIQRRLPKSVGGLTIFVSPDAALSYWQPRVETVDPWLLQMARELVGPGDIVWDIGANVGLFSFSAAGLAGPAGRVLAIEPDPWLGQLLRRSASQARTGAIPAASVDVLPFAMAEADGLCHFHIARRGRAANYLEGSAGSSQAGGTRETFLVPITACDSLLQHYPAPSVLKIDAEGADSRVLAGARSLLAKARPRILCEVSSSSAEIVTRILQSADYMLYDAQLSPSQRVPLERATFNTLAFPSEETAHSQAFGQRRAVSPVGPQG
jgi:FkbM family methyltransferase